MVENNILVAQHFGKLIAENEAFVLLAPVRLNTVCFTLSGNDNQHEVLPFLEKLNDTGKVFMTPTVYQLKQGIRAAFVNLRTTVSDVELVMQEMISIITNEFREMQVKDRIEKHVYLDKG